MTKSAFRDLAPAKCSTISYIFCLHNTIVFTKNQHLPYQGVCRKDPQFFGFCGSGFLRSVTNIQREQVQLFSNFPQIVGNRRVSRSTKCWFSLAPLKRCVRCLPTKCWFRWLTMQNNTDRHNHNGDYLTFNREMSKASPKTKGRRERKSGDHSAKRKSA